MQTKASLLSSLHSSHPLDASFGTSSIYSYVHSYTQVSVLTPTYFFPAVKLQEAPMIAIVPFFLSEYISDRKANLNK